MNHLTEKEVTQRYAESLEKLRIEKNLTQAEFAKSIGLTLATYKRIISGITTKIDINVAYTVMIKHGMTFVEMIGYSNPYIALAKQAQNLTKRQQTYVKALVDLECELRAKSNAEDYISIYVPTGNMQDGMIYDSSDIEQIDISEYRKIYGDKIHFGVKITSNHLHPAYNINDVLLMCYEPPRDGDNGIFINKETKRAYLRKFRQGNPCLLEPINGFGVTFKVNPNDKEDMDKWIKFGYVLTKIRH